MDRKVLWEGSRGKRDYNIFEGIVGLVWLEVLVMRREVGGGVLKIERLGGGY